MRRIAVYGKGGIGKSTTVSNLSVALTLCGYRVMQIGCDPKADSTRTLTGGKKIPTVLDVLRTKHVVTLSDIVVTGSYGVLCTESGGPIPGVGCAGRGIITAFEKLQELNAYSILQPDIVLYDVLGDVVCGGFAMPIRGGYADEVIIITSGEMMSLYAASNIAAAVRSFGNRGYAKLRGLILNSKGFDKEIELVEKVSKELEIPVLYQIPRSTTVQDAEALGKTVVEAFSDSLMSQHYARLARLLMDDTQGRCDE